MIRNETINRNKKVGWWNNKYRIAISLLLFDWIFKKMKEKILQKLQYSIFVHATLPYNLCPWKEIVEVYLLDPRYLSLSLSLSLLLLLDRLSPLLSLSLSLCLSLLEVLSRSRSRSRSLDLERLRLRDLKQSNEFSSYHYISLLTVKIS